VGGRGELDKFDYHNGPGPASHFFNSKISEKQKKYEWLNSVGGGMRAGKPLERGAKRFKKLSGRSPPSDNDRAKYAR
jgi:hypothetical protein